jgi:cytochrome P450
MSLLPCILDKTSYFLANLDHLAESGEEFLLSDLCTDLTFDIIGVVLSIPELDTTLTSYTGAVTMDIDMDHDTTSILLQWAIYELSRTPHALAAIKTELDKLLGSDTSPTTTKETLLKKRHNPPPANVLHCRRHQRNTPSLPALGNSAVYSPREWIHRTGNGGGDVVLDGVAMYNCESRIQRDEGVYGISRDEVRPERWLKHSKSSNPIPGSAFRPFERGSWNCIGQELANIEARIVLACVLRRYTWEKVGLGEIKLDGDQCPVFGC